ncbi:MAG: type I-E CRISPR-associated protein Cas6/Cse3/CasE [Geminicoccaceae bacterium]
MATETLWESRVTFAPPNPQAVLALLDRTAQRNPVQLGHRLLWSLFADGPGRQRDFLYLVEQERPFTAVVRSARPPLDGLGGMWRIERSYRFAPVLHEGMRLRFRLKAVPVTWVRHGAGEPTKRQDVIVAAWQRLPAQERADEDRRAEAAGTAIDRWLARQGEKSGFMVEEVMLLDYDRRRVPTGRTAQRIVFGAVTLEGRLIVQAAEPFRLALHQGLGSARGFGHGLLQIAPAGQAL